MSAAEAGQFMAICKTLPKGRWEFVVAARTLTRLRPLVEQAEGEVDKLLETADQAMVNAFTSGFRVAQVRQALAGALPEHIGKVALEATQIAAFAILVREQLSADAFATLYRPFATFIPGPGYAAPPPPARQVQLFVERLQALSGQAKIDVSTVARAMMAPPAQPPPPFPTLPSGAPSPPQPPPPFNLAELYNRSWKTVVAAADQAGRRPQLADAQVRSEAVPPRDGSGIVASAGMAGGALALRDVVPSEALLVVYEPFSFAIPLEILA